MPPASESAAAVQLTAGRRYAAAAAATGIALIVLVRFGITARGVIEAFTAAVLVALSAIDLDRRTLPNRIVVPAGLIVLTAQLAFFPEHWQQWLLASFGAPLLLMPLAYRGGMGMGDVKLAFLIGAALGRQVLAALLTASLFVVPWAVYLLARDGAAARRATLPFGPFMAAGAILVMLVVGPQGL